MMPNEEEVSVCKTLLRRTIQARHRRALASRGGLP